MTAKTPKANVFCLMGATASGKTALAVELSKRLPVEIISVDSAQIYRDMDIGTGKLDADTLALAPHALIDIRDPVESYSAAEFRSDALAEIKRIQQANKIPLLVGGTMLYFRVLRDGLTELPGANIEIRAQIEAMAKEQGWQAVHARLAQVDAQSAQRIHKNDPQRLSRALEVFMLTGKSMTQLHSEANAAKSAANAQLPFNLHYMAIQVADRASLHTKIASRFHGMLDAGLVAEVQALSRRGDLSESMPSMKSVGYRQVWQFLRDELSYKDMVERGIIATRQLAKRQTTWLRSWPDLTCLSDLPEKSMDEILKYIETTPT
ncbi:MAG: tRNA (adenosine(37)-N6)-dimethylallyltransferase MiaA [SAR86 cluster bacterium]|uniref:tRNA dimethylallyltransferase n=1 Tax=SAR86 cluster bacterium TaxID=2030880 RepID=A0A2A4MIF2_9GAMM|nr:MAG: tRNA (adenosine(37)-N6)-dimethylallyltransferase MiaA [SAR86 cluster bacterium]